MNNPNTSPVFYILRLFLDFIKNKQQEFHQILICDATNYLLIPAPHS